MTAKGKRPRATAAALAMFVAGLAAAAPADSRVEGRITDAAGTPTPGCRVIARATEGTTVFVSPPSDGEGRYAVEVPARSSYVLIALILSDGVRVALEESTPLAVGDGALIHDVTLPLPVDTGPPENARQEGPPDRFFLSFVEDPALAHYRHYEVQADYADFDFGDRTLLRGIVAMQFAGVPRVEVGARGGVVRLDIDGLADESGPTDLDVWGKFQLWRSADARIDLAVGAIATLPLGDEGKGLGGDAFQSKLFFSTSCSWERAVLVAHAGVATAEDGAAFGAALDGKIAGAAGVGVLVPFAPGVTAVFEANYEGERFADVDADANALAGVNWRLRPHGTLRLAASVGLGERADLAQIVVGYAFDH